MSELPSFLPGLDIASGLARVAGNKTLYLKLLRRVADDAKPTLDSLATAIGENDAAAIRALAHSLKGAAANLSIIDVAEAAGQVEQAGKAEDFAAIAASVDRLEKKLAEYAQVVKSLADL